jgi:hypothetical protein
VRADPIPYVGIAVYNVNRSIPPTDANSYAAGAMAAFARVLQVVPTKRRMVRISQE